MFVDVLTKQKSPIFSETELKYAACKKGSTHQVLPHKPLFDAQMCVDGGVACCAGQVLVFSVRDVLSRSVVSVLLCQTKVNKEQLTERGQRFSVTCVSYNQSLQMN